MSYKVFLNDYYDITNLTLQLPNVKESVISEMSDLQYKASFIINNQSEWLSIENENSIVFGNPINDFNIYIRNDDTLIYLGTITQIIENPEGTCEVLTTGFNTDLEKDLTQPIPNSTLDEIANEFVNLFEISYDNFSWKKSSMYYNDAYFSTKASPDNPLKLVDILKQMGETLGLWIYIKNNVLYCQPIFGQKKEYKVSLENNQVLNYEKEKSYDRMINNYSIKYGVDTLVKDDTNSNIGLASRKQFGEKSINIDGTYSSNVVIPNEDTALKIGNSYLNRYKDLFDIISFTVEKEICNYMSLLDVIRIEKFNKYYVVLDKEYDLNANTCRITAWEIL